MSGLNGGMASDFVSFPLAIKVRGPDECTACQSVMRALQMNAQVIAASVDPMAALTVSPFDFQYIVGQTNTPTMRPTRWPTMRPTRSPTKPPVAEEQTFPMQFNLDDIKPGYIPTEADQDAMLGMIEDIIREGLDNPDDLIRVQYIDEAGDGSNPSGRHLQIPSTNSLYLPIEVIMKSGSVDPYSDLLDIAENGSEELARELKEYDSNTFKDVDVSSEARDVGDKNVQFISHPAQFVYNNADPGCDLSPRDRDAFIERVEESLVRDIDDEWELTRVAYASRFLLEDVETPQLPVRVTVKVPADDGSEQFKDQVKDVIMRALNRARRTLDIFLEDMDQACYEGVKVTIGSEDLPDVTSPTFIQDHPIKVIFKNVPSGYCVSNRVRDAVIEWVKGLVRDNLNEYDTRNLELELKDITYAGRGGANCETSMPLKVMVRAKVEAREHVLSYLLQMITDYVIDFKTFLITLDENAFKDVTIEAETFDIDEVVEITTVLRETKHYIQLILVDAPVNYIITASDRAAAARLVGELLETHLHEDWEFVTAVYIPYSNVLPSLPLRIAIKGPADESEFALAYVMDVLKDHLQELELLFKSLDWNNLKHAKLSVESFDPNVIPVELVETEHLVQLNMENMPSRYSLTEQDKSLAVKVVGDVLEENLDNGMELVGVEYLGGDRNLRATRRRLDTVTLFLRVNVLGPDDISDFAETYVLVVLDDNRDEIKRRLWKGLRLADPSTFNDIVVTVTTYGGSSTSITNKPMTKQENNDGGISLLAWGSIVLGLLLAIMCLCLCSFCLAIRQRRIRSKSEDEATQETKVVVEKTSDALVPYEGNPVVVQETINYPEVVVQEKIPHSQSYEYHHRKLKSIPMYVPNDDSSALAVESMASMRSDPPSEHDLILISSAPNKNLLPIAEDEESSYSNAPVRTSYSTASVKQEPRTSYQERPSYAKEPSGVYKFDTQESYTKSYVSNVWEGISSQSESTSKNKSSNEHMEVYSIESGSYHKTTESFATENSATASKKKRLKKKRSKKKGRSQHMWEGNEENSISTQPPEEDGTTAKLARDYNRRSQTESRTVDRAYTMPPEHFSYEGDSDPEDYYNNIGTNSFRAQPSSFHV